MDLDKSWQAAEERGAPARADAAPADTAAFERVVAGAVAMVPGCEACGLIVHGHADVDATLVASDSAAVAVDRRQHDVGQGPALESSESGASLLAGDLCTDPRWPLWTPYAVRQGFRSVLTVRLHTEQGAVGALNIYGTTVDAFDDEAVDLTEIFAEHAAASLDRTGVAIGLRTALRARHRIGVAQGVLAARYGLGIEDSFDLLRDLADESGLKLRDVADLVVAERGLAAVLRRLECAPR